MKPEPKISIGLGIVLGIAAACVAVPAWIALGAWSGGLFPEPNCVKIFVPRAFYLVTLGSCLAALGFGVQAARRGEPGLSALLMLPAIGVLLPATPCAIAALSACW